jgi:hypothetical protein
MKLLDAVVTTTVAQDGTATLQLVFDQLPIGNSLCGAIVNHGKGTIKCTSVKKYPNSLTGDYAIDTGEVTNIGTLQPFGNLSGLDRYLIVETTFSYKAVQYVFGAGTAFDQIVLSLSVASPR